MALLAGVVALSAPLATPQAARAEDPVDLGSSRVVDTAEVLSASDESKINDAIDELSSSKRVDLFVVYVDTFTNPSDYQAWANTTAENNNLGPDDYLLAVAVEDRAFYISADDGGPVSQDDVGRIEQENVEPRLREEDWAGAALAAAQGLSEQIGAQSAGGGFNFFWVFIIGAIAIGLLVFFLVRRKKAVSAGTGHGVPGGPITPAEPPAVPTEELARQASSALIRTDDAIKTSGEELGFAIAQYGKEATAQFEQALTNAKAAMSQAFMLKQQLDDRTPDSEADTRGWNQQIITLCANADASLDTESKAFDELRALEKNAPQALEQAKALLPPLTARIAPANETLAQLAAKYDDETIATVADNTKQASERLNFADASLKRAATAIGTDTSDAAVAIREAESAADQAGLLLDAIDGLKSDISRADDDIRRNLDDLNGDLAAANAQAGASNGALAGVIASTSAIVADVKAQVAAGRYRPLEALKRLGDANTAMDAALAGVRDAAQAAQRARAALGQAISTAQARVSEAENYITSRRGAVAEVARTRLAEAGRALSEAQSLEQADPQSALSRAQQSEQLASSAIDAARSDIGSFETGGLGTIFGDSGGGFGDIFGPDSASGYSQGSSDDGLIGAILGGILSSGGGSRNRSYGGSFGGFGGFGGGGSSRSSRSGGGNFGFGGSSGGGSRSRSGGGRF